MRLPTQYGSHEFSLLYFAVDGKFTPLLGCDTCLDLEVLEFMNVELINTPESKQPEQELPIFFQTDPVLQDYRDCLSDKRGKLPNKVYLEVDPSFPSVVHPPKKFQMHTEAHRVGTRWNYCKRRGTHPLRFIYANDRQTRIERKEHSALEE